MKSDVEQVEATFTNPVEQNLDQAKKIHNYELAELCRVMMNLIIEKNGGSKLNTYETYMNIHKKTIILYNLKRELNTMLEEKEKLIKCNFKLFIIFE